MKEAEKRDLILRKLYEHRHDRDYHPLLNILMQDLGIYESSDEVDRIAKRLKSDGYAHTTPIALGRFHIKITSQGIDYCELNSYSHPGQPVINLNFSGAFNATNMILGANNSNNHQSVSTTLEAEALIKRIKENIQRSTEIDQESKEALMECVEDIDEKVKDKKTISKYQWSTLLNNTASLTQVSSFAIQLAQICGHLPA